LRLDGVPDGVKAMIKQQLGEKLDAAREQKNEGETKSQQKFRLALIAEVARHLGAGIRDGKELTIDLDVDKKTQVLSVDVQLTALPNTELAKTINQVGGAKSLFGGLMHKEAALNVLVHVDLPDKLREALGEVIDEGGKKAIADTKDEGKKSQVAK